MMSPKARRDIEVVVFGFLWVAAGLLVTWAYAWNPAMLRYWADVVLLGSVELFIMGLAIAVIACCRFAEGAPFADRIVTWWDAVWTWKRAVLTVLA